MQMYQQPPSQQQQLQFSLQQEQQEQEQEQHPFDLLSSSPLSNATFESFLFDNTNSSINSDNPNDINNLETNNNDNCNNNDNIWNFDEFIQFDIEDQNGMLQVPPLSSPPSNNVARRRSSSVNTPFPNVSYFINSFL